MLHLAEIDYGGCSYLKGVLGCWLDGIVCLGRQLVRLCRYWLCVLVNGFQCKWDVE